MITTEMDSFHLGLVERLLRGTLVAAALSTAAALTVDLSASISVSAGAAVGLLLVSFHRRLFPSLVRCGGAGFLVYGLVWLAKWFALGVPLYLGMESGLIVGGWFCLGVSLLPAVAVILALRAIAADLWPTAVAKRSVPLP